MAMQKKAQQANTLLTKYCSLWEGKYGRPITVNRFKMKWGVVDMIDSVGYEKAEAIIDYYFRTAKNRHPLEWLLYNFEDLAKMMDERASDDERRAKQREITRRRVEEWKERNEQLRSETN